ncbi:MAG TPA: 3-carboxy-cis,cis-muconate cycloisomerase [Candidatus Angelobacter sp.]|nr:3-carboxy-cis,cis-muconate cycloisomerase [Candidatus Angelobacter sp.]
MRLIESLATTGPLAEVFSDRSLLQSMLEFEVALARAESRFKVIPSTAVEAITAAAVTCTYDSAGIARETMHAGTPAIPLIKALTECVRSKNSSAAGFVHWGATSQDVCDTALVLLLRKAQAILQSDLKRLQRALRRLAEEHAGVVMLGRTLLQAAPPTTFGLKAAGWLAAIHRSRERLNAGFQESLVLQFGGASGTLAALGDKGLQVGQALADELHLGYPDAPWHTHRDRFAALVCACGMLTGSLGKMARDISLMMQTEIAEAEEPVGENRGGSSTMPHKHNPVGCSAALAAAVRVPALVSSFLSAMVQEHERALGGWQAEWAIISSVVQSAGLAAAAMAEVAEGLKVNASQMRATIATHGFIFAERAMMLLANKLGRDVAHRLLEEATQKSRQYGIKLSQVLAEMPEVNKHIDPATLRELETPEHYLGVAEEFRKRLLASQNLQPGGTEVAEKKLRTHKIRKQKATARSQRPKTKG